MANKPMTHLAQFDRILLGIQGHFVANASNQIQIEASGRAQQGLEQLTHAHGQFLLLVSWNFILAGVLSTGDHWQMGIGKAAEFSSTFSNS